MTVLLIVLGICLGITVGIGWMIAAELMGAPFVPSSQNFNRKILKAGGLTADSYFMDLGSGDGRVVRLAAVEFGARAAGVEIQPYLRWWARLISNLRKIRTDYYGQNLFSINLRQADYIYCYLLPETMCRLATKLERECKSGCVVMSRGFAISGWEKRLTKTITDGGRRGYIYKK